MVTWSKSAVETGNFAEDRQSDAIISAPSLMYHPHPLERGRLRDSRDAPVGTRCRWR